MRLEDYWGIGPKTRTLLVDELGEPAAIEAIQRADVRTLTASGLARGRATRILRQVHGGDALDLLETRDTRDVYKQLLDTMTVFAVTADAADSIRILTPLDDRTAMEQRLDDVLEARETWRTLDGETRDAVVAAFDRYDDSTGGDRPAVLAALELRELDLEAGVFEPLAGLDPDVLADAESALAGLASEGDAVGEGADERLDALRTQLGALEDMAATPGSVLDTVEAGVRGTDELREELARHVAEETGIDLTRVRAGMAQDATDARAFVGETLRTLAGDLREAVDDREREVREQYEAVLDEADEDVETAVRVIDDIALSISLARFALAFDLQRPSLVDRRAIGVVDARNLFLDEAAEDVQPVSYALGDHDLQGARSSGPPRGDRVTVLTGANSGGKTTLLETLCQVQLLAQMGLPVPAEQAELGPVDAIVFHRRHASFNAGVLESTLRSVVPPVTDDGRTLMLVDEFEAITEPGSAADLLHGLVTLTVEKDALGVFVTHLADDLEPLPDEARTDGIFAEGLTTDLELKVDYQPRFGTVGRSTPEFIVSRLVADAEEVRSRSGYEHLAHAVGERAVQRTLADARWSE